MLAASRALALMLFSGFVPCVAAGPAFTESQSGLGATHPNEIANMQVLMRGQAITARLTGGQSHFYCVKLVARQYIRIVAEQIGVDLQLKLSGPNGVQLAKINRWDYLGTTEVLSWIAQVSGSYQIEVQAVNSKAPPGLYTLKIAQVRASVVQDQTLIDAERAYDKADDLSSAGDPQSLRAAIDELQSSLELWRKVGDRLFEASTLVYLGADLYSSGDPARALDYYQQALRVWHVTGDVSGEAVTLSFIAGLEEAVGEFEESLTYSRKALLLARKLGDKRLEAQILHDLGMAYYFLGESDTALRYQNEALTLAKVSGDQVWEAHILHHIGEIYVSKGEVTKALRFLNSALERSHTQGDRLGEATTLNHLGQAYAFSGDTQKAFVYYSQALDLRRKNGYRLGEAQTLLSLGRAYDSVGQESEALSHFLEALQVSKGVAALPEEASALYGAARAQRNLGDLSAALTTIRQALQIAESQRLKVHSEELRASYFGTLREFYDFYIDLLMEMHFHDPDSGFAVKALEASEFARARMILEMLNDSHATVGESTDPVLLERERSLQQLIDGKREVQISLLGSKHTEEEASELKKELDEILSQYREVEGEIRAKNPHYAALTQPRTLGVSEIQSRLLDADSLLVEYELGEQRSYAWLVTPTSVSSFELPKRVEIEKLARRAYELLTERNREIKGETSQAKRDRCAKADQDYSRVATALSEIVLRPFAPLLAQKRLVVVSDGALQYIPFGALPVARIKANENGANNQSDGNDQVPLIMEHEVLNLPSASVLGELREEVIGREQAPKMVSIFADPVFDRHDPRVKWSSSTQSQRSAEILGTNPTETELASSMTQRRLQRSAVEAGAASRLHFARLIFTRREARSIMEATPLGEGTENLDFSASRASAMSRGLSQYRVVHFATHALLDSEHPELSGLVLSLVDKKGKPQRGFLDLEDVYNLKLRADLVVLSACETALGREIRGEGLVGLTRGFMYAGVPSVVASLWKVDDLATSELMKQFYELMLKENRRPASALREAQITMMQQKRWAPPYYWAAFTMQGEWK